MVSPVPKRITGHALKLQNALSSTEWLTRSQIAAAIGKRKLTPYDTLLLDLLAERGLIESRQREGGSREGFTWEYRGKG